MGGSDDGYLPDRYDLVVLELSRSTSTVEVTNGTVVPRKTSVFGLLVSGGPSDDDDNGDDGDSRDP